MTGFVIIPLLLAVAAGIGMVLTRASKERREVLARLDRERTIRPGYSPTAELFRSAGVSEAHIEQMAPFVSAPRIASADPPTSSIPAPVSPEATGASWPSDRPSQWPSEHAVVSAPTAGAKRPPAPSPAAPAPTVPASAPAPAPSAPAPTVSMPAVAATSTRASGGLSMLRHVSIPAGFVPLGPEGDERVVFAVERSARSVRDQIEQLFAEAGASVSWLEPTVAAVARDGERALVSLYPDAHTTRDLDGNALFPTARPDETVVRITAA